jgi:hypothetical protein
MAETSSYIPPQSPIAIQPGDTGFKTVAKGYNRWLWTFADWKNSKKKIINPDTNWDLNAKPTKNSKISKKMKHLYLKEEFDSMEVLKGGLSDGMTLEDLAKKHDPKGYYEVRDMVDFLKRQLEAGIKVEGEHTSDPQMAKEIAMDHLFEDPNYYIKLKKIEK